MPSTFNTLSPTLSKAMKSVQSSLEISAELAHIVNSCQRLWVDSLQTCGSMGFNTIRTLNDITPAGKQLNLLTDSLEEIERGIVKASSEILSVPGESYERSRRGESEFFGLFCETPPSQGWSEPGTVLMDLPGLRLIDVSRQEEHSIHNYTVVFAPRAGHHSNIAERVALYMRDHGLSRMAIVEQKCAREIPLYVEGKHHHENFDGQVEQYRQILECLKEKTGTPAHLVAICQPGPLLLAALILYPHLGKTYGSAGAPMNTDSQHGFLSDFARFMGEGYIDLISGLFGSRVPEGLPGEGRAIYDGRLQVLGFYLLGMQQHLDNFKELLNDLRWGDKASAKRQMAFYQWYNYSHDFPASFIRDTYKKIFVHNELIRGKLQIQGKTIDIRDYPVSVPLWALGGLKDDIAPVGQAIGHVDLIPKLAPEDRLVLTCDAGHMGLFRSQRILDSHYSRVVHFLLERSDHNA